MNQHIMKAAAALGVTVALATGCSSKGTGINATLASPDLTTTQNSDPQGGDTKHRGVPNLTMSLAVE
jgi:predicted TIM-barrel fold metal-dependent hydrolase